MDPVEAVKALTVASAYDNRNVTREAGIVWADALADLTLAEVVDAIKHHYAGTTTWLMPAHVRTAVKALRADRLERIRPPAPNVDPDDPAAQMAEQRALRDAIASGRMDEAEVARYEAGGWNLTGERVHYALGSQMKSRPAIAAAFAGVFRDAKGNRSAPRARVVPTLAQVEADHLAAARARLDAEAQS